MSDDRRRAAATAAKSSGAGRATRAAAAPVAEAGEPKRKGKKKVAAPVPAAPSATGAKPPATPPPGGVTIRHYCQGIGDCHLLLFPRDGGGTTNVLIDCGIHSSVPGGSAKMDAIVDDLALACGGRIDVLVITHEHWDHVSGFLTAAEGFKNIAVGVVWLAWTENPRDRQARDLDKYKSDMVDALQFAGSRLAADTTSPHLAAVGRGIEGILGFQFGAAGQKVRSARDAAVALGKGEPVYHEPGTGPLRLPGVTQVGVYVLGPPRQASFLSITDRASELYGFAAAGPIAAAAMDAGYLGRDDDLTAPFDGDIGLPYAEMLKGNAPTTPEGKATGALLRDHYIGTEAAWRRVDDDWLGISAELAMRLDDRTNNTSLVLGFALQGRDRFLLFTGDAQVGNWLSWQDMTWGNGADALTAGDLLKRTIYLKVGHHGSHNATPKQHGLERMTHADLAAFVPVNEIDAKRVKWNEMPFDEILATLAVRTGGRTIRADDPWLTNPGGPVPHNVPTGALRAVDHDPTGLWVEVVIA